MKRVLFVINPVAGTMKAKPHLMKILQTLSDGDLSVTVYTTRAKGDASAYVAAHAGEYDEIVCCGGDGTLSETISGLINADLDIPIGYIPAGSTNDLARTLGLPTDIEKAAENIVKGVPTGFDIGLINGKKTFSYVASFGAFTRTSYATPQSMKNVLGHLAYILSGVKELGKIEKYDMTVEAGAEKLRGELIFGAVTNSLSVAGIFKLSPSRVSLNDGKFEVLLIRTPKDIVELGRIVSHITDGSYEDPNLVFIQTDRIAVSCAKSSPWTVDGEFGGNYCGVGGDILINNMHDRVHIILPPAEKL